MTVLVNQSINQSIILVECLKTVYAEQLTGLVL